MCKISIKNCTRRRLPAVWGGRQSARSSIMATDTEKVLKKVTSQCVVNGPDRFCVYVLFSNKRNHLLRVDAAKKKEDF